jgi:predicted O-methyltransferase YrrM
MQEIWGAISRFCTLPNRIEGNKLELLLSENVLTFPHIQKKDSRSSMMDLATIRFHLTTLRESEWKRRSHPNLDGHAPDIAAIRSHPDFGTTEQMVGIHDVWARKTFTNKWFTASMADVWQHHFFSERARIREALEVGSYEGRSTLFIASLFPGARITCIDSFLGSDEHREKPDLLSNLEAVFDQNIAECGERIVKQKGLSAAVLGRLQVEQRSYDFCFIDAGHFHDDVYVDSALAWELLNVGGILVWDDYFWDGYQSYFKNVRAAVDRFLDVHTGEYKVLFSGEQVAVKKIAPTRRQVINNNV